jgi:hypothetical protein
MLLVYFPLLYFGILHSRPTMLLFAAGGLHWSTRQ